MRADYIISTTCKGTDRIEKAVQDDSIGALGMTSRGCRIAEFLVSKMTDKFSFEF